MHRYSIAVALALATTLTGCESCVPEGADPNRIDVAVEADPVRGFAPFTATLSAELIEIAEDVVADDVRYEWFFGDGTTGNGRQVTHTWDQAGEYVVSVEAIELDNGTPRSTASATLSIEALPPADLSFTAPIISSPSNTIRSDETFRVTTELRNAAAPADIPFALGLYVAPTAAVQPGSVLSVEELNALTGSNTVFQIWSANLNSFEGGSATTTIDERELSIPTSVPGGEYGLFAFADTGGVVGEFDEDNNIAWGTRTIVFLNATIDGPDLLSQGFRATPSRTNEITSVSLDGSIVNAGTQPALQVNYEVYLSIGDANLDSADIRISRELLQTVVPGLPVPLSGIELLVDPPIRTIGDYFVLLLLDADEDVTETNEANNLSVAGPIVVTDQPIPDVDIVVDSFELRPGTTFAGGSVQVLAEISNIGVESTERQFICRAYISEDDRFDVSADLQLATFNIGVIDGGQSASIDELESIPGFFPTGDFHVFLFCDASLAIIEADEDNNVLRAPVLLRIAEDASVDLSIAAATVSPSTLTNDTFANVSMQICNDGSNGATPSRARARISVDATVDATDTVLADFDVPALEPGECVTVQRDVIVSCDTFVSQYTVFFIADSTGVIPETDETNNTVAELNSLFIEGLICDCEADIFEANESSLTPSPIDLNAGPWDDLTLCLDESADWYVFDLLQGDTVQSAITFDGARGNLDLTLYAPDRVTILDRSVSEGDREEVVYFAVPENGSYVLEVAGRADADRNVYDLSFSVTPPDSGIDLIAVNVDADGSEHVLGDIIPLTADIVNLGDTPAGTSLARLYLSDNIDINPAFDTALGEVTVPAIAPSSRVTIERTVQVPATTQAGTWYIGVIVDATSVVSEISETNNVGLSGAFEVTTECFDGLEPNNSIEAPRLLEFFVAPPVLYDDLLVCTGNRDYYEVCAEDGDFLGFEVGFDTSDGDIDIKLYDDALAEVSRSEGVSGVERIFVDYVAGDRCYILEVYIAGNNRQAPYSLTVEQGRAPDELQCPNGAEPDDSFGAAALLRDWLDADLAVCPDGDEDFFALSLTSGSNITVNLVPAGDALTVPRDLRITVYGPARNFIANTVTATEVLNLDGSRIAVSGTYYFRVRSNGDGPRRQEYRIAIDGITGVDLRPTNFNVEPTSATPGQDVRFTFDLSNTRTETAPQSRYEVSLSTDPVPSADDIIVRSELAPPLEGLSERAEGRKFTVPALPADGGLYYVILRIDPDNDISEFVETNNVAIATLSVISACDGDTAEPNNTHLDARPLEDHADTTLTLCTGDNDWFDVVGTAGSSVDVAATFSHADGDIDLRAYDSALNLIEVSDTNTDDERLNFGMPSDGRAFILVTSIDSAISAEYTLSLVSAVD